MNTNSKFTFLLRLIGAGLFFLLLWIPIVQMICPFLPEMNSTENRKLAEKPKMKLSFKVMKNYNRYINDHYGLRNIIVRANGMIHVNLLRTSPTRDVLLGKEGWLYYDRTNEGISLKDFYGDAPLSEQELGMIVEKIIRINRFCEGRGILFKIVVAPNKHTIYPEFLPLDIKNRQGVSTCLDQLRNALTRNKLESVLIDLRPTLISNKGIKPYPLYYLTDTHWNQMGAFIAYTEIMKNLLPRFPHIKILNIKKYSVLQKENRGIGDLSAYISMSGLLKDTEIVLKPQFPYLAKKIHPRIELEGTYDIERYHIENCNYPKLLLFQDSFACSLLPYLSESFSDSLYVWYTPSDVNLSVIEQEMPHVVILELAERHLHYLSKPLLSTFKKTQGKS